MTHERIFRPYDIRGAYPEELDEKGAEDIGRVLSIFFRRGTLVLGFDARKSSPALYEALKRGLASNEKISLSESGLITTPMLYFLVNHEGAAGGVMVTASHNPKNWNGFKMVGKGAVPISGIDVLKFL